jgi:hypothetical protein
MKQYTAKNGNIQYKPSLQQLEDAFASDSSIGFCLACGAENEGIEPDAGKYTCLYCKAAKVYGVESLMLMNLFH